MSSWSSTCAPCAARRQASAASKHPLLLSCSLAPSPPLLLSPLFGYLLRHARARGHGRMQPIWVAQRPLFPCCCCTSSPPSFFCSGGGGARSRSRILEDESLDDGLVVVVALGHIAHVRRHVSALRRRGGGGLTAVTQQGAGAIHAMHAHRPCARARDGARQWQRRRIRHALACPHETAAAGTQARVKGQGVRVRVPIFSKTVILYLLPVPASVFSIEEVYPWKSIKHKYATVALW